jgi:hypothetical protein
MSSGYFPFYAPFGFIRPFPSWRRFKALFDFISYLAKQVKILEKAFEKLPLFEPLNSLAILRTRQSPHESFAYQLFLLSQLAKQVKIFKEAVETLPPIPESPRGPIKRRLKLDSPSSVLAFPRDVKRPKNAPPSSDSSEDEIEFHGGSEGAGKLARGGKKGGDLSPRGAQSKKKLLSKKDAEDGDASAIGKGEGQVKRGGEKKAGLKGAGEDHLVELLTAIKRDETGGRKGGVRAAGVGGGEREEDEDEDEFEKRYAGIPVSAEEARLGSGNFGALVSGDVSPSARTSARSDESPRARSPGPSAKSPPLAPVSGSLKRKRSTAEVSRRRPSSSDASGEAKQQVLNPVDCPEDFFERLNLLVGFRIWEFDNLEQYLLVILLFKDPDLWKNELFDPARAFSCFCFATETGAVSQTLPLSGCIFIFSFRFPVIR